MLCWRLFKSISDFPPFRHISVRLGGSRLAPPTLASARPPAAFVGALARESVVPAEAVVAMPFGCMAALPSDGAASLSSVRSLLSRQVQAALALASSRAAEQLSGARGDLAAPPFMMFWRRIVALGVPSATGTQLGARNHAVGYPRPAAADTGAAGPKTMWGILHECGYRIAPHAG